MKTPNNQNRVPLIEPGGGGIPYPRFPHGLNLEQARRLDQGNSLDHLQQDYQTLSQEVTHLALI